MEQQKKSWFDKTRGLMLVKEAKESTLSLPFLHIQQRETISHQNNKQSMIISIYNARYSAESSRES